MMAENGNRVKVHFVGRLQDGTVFGETTADKPLQFTLGKDDVIPGFVEALHGMEPGQKKKVQLPPEKGFGKYDPEKLVHFDRNRFARREPLSKGMEVVLKDVSGQEFVGRVDSYNDKLVTLDMNHPLAGQALEFEIELKEVA